MSDCTPEQILNAIRENPQAPTFADLLDRQRALVQAIEWYLGESRSDDNTPRGREMLEQARDRLNAETKRAGIRWG